MEGARYTGNAGRVCIVMLVALLLWTGATTGLAQNAAAASQERKRLTGTVSDPDGEPLVGASVKILNTGIGTVTNIDGLYVIDVRESETLSFSYLGFLKKDVKVGKQNVLNIVLEQDAQMFEEVVVIGYGKQKRAAMVSSISSVTSRELTAPTSNLTNNLSGQLAGLISIQRTAEPGRDDAEFWIRGISSFAGGTKPLVLVDGVPRDINNLEPDEIETFSLLKDAAATAVYGAEGANGVILVTTKRGTISKPRISFRAEHSIAQPQRIPEFVDSWDYLELANEALFNDGLSPYMPQETIEKYRSGEDPDLYPNAKWMDELLTKNVHNQRYTLGFRGGAENAKYFVSLAYFQQDGVFKENPMGKYDSDFGFERYNLRSNIDLKVSKTTDLSVDISGQYTKRRSANRSADHIFSFMLNTPPHLFPPIYSDGTLATYAIISDENNRNPFNMLYNQGYRLEDGAKIQSAVNVTQDLSFLTPGLSLRGKASFDYDGNYGTLRDYHPSLFYADKEKGRDADGNLSYITSYSGSPTIDDPIFQNDYRSSYRKIYVEGSLNYLRDFGKHNVGGMLLVMQKESQHHDVILPYRKQSLVGRASYSFDNRYFMEANFGYTGSETFAANHRFGFFPAVGVSYFVSNEHFYPQALKNVLNNAKLRLSYGRTGNDDVDPDKRGNNRFLYRATFKTDGYTFNQGFGSTGATNGMGAGLRDLLFTNPDIHWEIEVKRNAGLDLGLFNNQIELTVDYFNNRRSDILIQRNTIPTVAGFHERPWENYGIVDNHGIDGSMTARRDFGKVLVSARGTFTFARNKIIERDELPKEYPWQVETGTRINEHTLYLVERLYTEDDFIATQNDNGTYSYQLKPGLPEPSMQNRLGPGDLKYADLNNDGIIDTNDKQRVVGHPYNPEINYGFGLNIDYKGFYASVFFQGVANSTILMSDGNSTFWPFNWKVEKSNYWTAFLDRWTADNPRQDVVMPRIHSEYAYNINKEQSNWWLRNGNFLRFKNLEVGYNVPKNFAHQIGIEAARIYLLGYNLHVWDSLKLWDPEFGNRNKGMDYPMSRTFTLGIELNF
jgi:TonB-linked SusC/RagA family outer membrane protein